MQDFSKTKIAVIGSTMMDLTVYADVLPAAGETRFGESFTTGFGGKGANQAGYGCPHWRQSHDDYRYRKRWLW